jgi:hypothetical protein
MPPGFTSVFVYETHYRTIAANKQGITSGFFIFFIIFPGEAAMRQAGIVRQLTIHPAKNVL